MDELGSEAGLAGVSIDHPNVVRLERELMWSAAGWEHILVVVTDLTLDPSAPDHDPTAIHRMTEAVSRDMQAVRQGFHRIVIRRDGAAGLA